MLSKQELDAALAAERAMYRALSEVQDITRELLDAVAEQSPDLGLLCGDIVDDEPRMPEERALDTVEALAAFGQFLAASPWNAAAVLLAMGAAFFALSWLLLRRAMIRPAK